MWSIGKVELSKCKVVAVLKKVVRVSLIEKMTSEQGLKEVRN